MWFGSPSAVLVHGMTGSAGVIAPAIELIMGLYATIFNEDSGSRVRWPAGNGEAGI